MRKTVSAVHNYLSKLNCRLLFFLRVNFISEYFTLAFCMKYNDFSCGYLKIPLLYEYELIITYDIM